MPKDKRNEAALFWTNIFYDSMILNNSSIIPRIIESSSGLEKIFKLKSYHQPYLSSPTLLWKLDIDKSFPQKTWLQTGQKKYGRRVVAFWNGTFHSFSFIILVQEKDYRNVLCTSTTISHWSTCHAFGILRLFCTLSKPD